MLAFSQRGLHANLYISAHGDPFTASAQTGRNTDRKCVITQLLASKYELLLSAVYRFKIKY